MLNIQKEYIKQTGNSILTKMIIGEGYKGKSAILILSKTISNALQQLGVTVKPFTVDDAYQTVGIRFK